MQYNANRGFVNDLLLGRKDLRVISGTARGCRLRAVPGSGTRPITDRAKSALFSILGTRVRGCAFLDLYAGTGQVGIEALSRAATVSVFVEQGRAAIRTIRENLSRTRLKSGARVVRADVFHFLRRDATPFDHVFVAPPQYKELWAATLEALDAKPEWLAPDGMIIVQIHPREFGAQPLENFVLLDQRTYGGVMLCFFGWADSR